MEIEKSEYENIRAALKSIVSSKIVNEKCEGTKKEQLLDFIIFFDNNGYTFFTQLKLSSIKKDNLLEDLKLIAEKIVKESVYNIKESEMMDVVDKYLRLYNNILLSLNDNEKIRLIQIKFDKQKSYIDKKIEEFDSLLESKKKEIEALSSSFLSQIDEKDKSLEEKVTHIENIESSFVALQNKINKSQDDFEKEIKDKQEEFYKELTNKSDSFKNDINKRLKGIDDDVHRQELAGYFLAEKEKLKGEVNMNSLYSLLAILIILITCLSFSTSIIEILQSFSDNKNWQKIAPFLLCVLGLFMLYKLIRAWLRTNAGENKFWLCTPYWGWLYATIIGACLIFATSTNVYLHCKGLNYNNLIHRFPLFMILVWYTWFCAKQFSYYRQICDEYEYKYLLSMSYLSYRNEANDLTDVTGDKGLLVTLLDSVIKNISRSPVQSIKTDYCTPLAEVANAMKLTFGKDVRKDNS